MSLQEALTRVSSGTHSQGHQQDVEDAAVNYFQQMFGRSPTQEEFSSALPSFDTNVNAGQSFLAQYKQSIDNSPEGLQKKNLELYTKNKGGWDDQINQYFKSSLGRDATEAEKSHFGSLLASGQVDQYGLTQFLQNLPEYTNAQDKKFQDEQRSGLEAADTKYYTDKLLPAIQSQMAGAGRSLESSGYASAMAQAAKQQATEREKYLTNLSASQYQGRTGQARSDYENYINTLNSNTTRNQNLSDAVSARSNSYADYNTQRDAYNEYLARYGKKKGNMAQGAISGGVSGAAAGAPFGPLGAGIGGVLGAGLGAFGQS